MRLEKSHYFIPNIFTVCGFLHPTMAEILYFWTFCIIHDQSQVLNIEAWKWENVIYFIVNMNRSVDYHRIQFIDDTFCNDLCKHTRIVSVAIKRGANENHVCFP